MGPWLVEPLKGSITEPDGEAHHLQPKVMDVLVCLAEHADEPVTRDQILEEVWGENAVSDEPLTRAIGELRRALHDTRAHPDFIQTIPKRGYRLIGDIVVTTETVEKPTQAFTGRRLSTTVTLLGIIVLAVVALQSRIILMPGADQYPIEEAPANSIAVLPFETCASDSDGGMLSERIADEVRESLARIDAVTVSAVTARPLMVIDKSSSFVLRQSGLTPEEIGRELKVRYMLNGSICHEAGQTTIKLSLIDGYGFLKEATEFTLDPSADASLSTNAAASIVNLLSEWLGTEPLGPGMPLVASEAREQLLIARQYLERSDIDRARTALDASLLIQPDYAEAIYQLALLKLRGLDVDQRVGLENARDLANQALQHALNQFLDAPIAFETNLVVGQILASLADWERNLVWRSSGPFDVDAIRTKYSEAERYLVAAVKANPNSSAAAEVLADVVAAQGRHDESLAILEAARHSDPFNLGLSSRIAVAWAATGRFRDAIEMLQRFEQLPMASAYAWNKQLELMQIHGYWDEQCATFIRLLNDHPDVAAHGQIRFQASWFIGDLLHLGLFSEAEVWQQSVSVSDLPEWAQLYAERFRLWGIDDQPELTRRTHERLQSMTDQEFLDPWYNLPMNWAWDIAAGGDVERAIILMEQLQDAPALYVERETLPTLLLARLYHRAGRHSDAAPLLDNLRRRLESEMRAGLKHPESLFRLAEVYALQGLNESAVNVLRMAVAAHWRMPWWRLPWNTDLNGLDSDPRVAELRSIVESDLEAQAARIREMLSQHDLDELLAPLGTIGQDSEAPAR